MSPLVSASPSSPAAISMNSTRLGWLNTAAATARHMSTKNPDHVPSASRIDSPTLSGCTPHLTLPCSKTVKSRCDSAFAVANAASASSLHVWASAYALAAGVNASRAAIAVESACDVKRRFSPSFPVWAAHDSKDATVATVRETVAIANSLSGNAL